jgi:hypothetical protein
MKMNIRIAGAAGLLSLGLLPLAQPEPARALGCFTGAAAGAVAGHYLHHHAILGAVGGCIAGHHLKVMQRRKEAAAAAAAKNPPPAPAMTPKPMMSPAQ